MARVNNIQTDLQNVGTIEALRRFVGAALNSIVLQMNGKLDIVDNLRASGPLNVSIPSANTPVKIVHNLNRDPIGYWVVGQDAAVSVYYPSQAVYPWTPQQIYLSASGAVNLTIFVI